MTKERFYELRTAGPIIKAEDWERLKNFTPRLSIIAASIRLAFLRTWR